jgi:hypothetical protein
MRWQKERFSGILKKHTGDRVSIKVYQIFDYHFSEEICIVIHDET